MNIEQIAVGVKDAHGLDMSDETAITLLRHALSKLAEQAGSEPVAEVYRAHYGNRVRDIGFDSVRLLRDANVTPGDKLYTESQLIAAQQKAEEACVKVCEDEMDNYHYGDEGRIAAKNNAEAIRNGEWRKYL